VKTILLQSLLVLLLLPLLALAGWYGWNIHANSEKRAKIKMDYSYVNSIQCGLLSVNAWKEDIQKIIVDKIDSFRFSTSQKADLKKEINTILYALVAKGDKMINEKQTHLSGKIKQRLFHMFVDMDKIKAQVPEYSQIILNEITKPQNKQKLKSLATVKLSELASQTRDSLAPDSIRNSLLVKYGVTNVESFNSTADEQCEALDQQISIESYRFLGILILFLLLWGMLYLQKAIRRPLFILSVILALIALITGISSPMIEIDVRIKELNFLILDRYIVFHDQVMFYQSKSILDVVHILINTQKIEMVAVGILILIFSIIFPLSKLISTEIYLLGNQQIKENRLVYFFALRSGKWSMADVMVIAIFMAYVGFKGILDDQLKMITVKTYTLSSIATDKTLLQPGFIVFLAFVLFGLILSIILEKITEKKV